jgi:hypothetical protein
VGQPEYVPFDRTPHASWQKCGPRYTSSGQEKELVTDPSRGHLAQSWGSEGLSYPGGLTLSSASLEVSYHGEKPPQQRKSIVEWPHPHSGIDFLRHLPGGCAANTRVAWRKKRELRRDSARWAQQPGRYGSARSRVRGGQAYMARPNGCSLLYLPACIFHLSSPRVVSIARSRGREAS